MAAPAWTLQELHDVNEAGGADPRSLVVCYREHHARLVRLLTLRTGDRAMAEDLAHDTFLKLMKRLDIIDRPAQLWPWLRTVALNLATDRDRQRAPGGRPRETTAELLAELPTPGRDAVEGVADRQLLLAALKDLPVRHREVLLLRYLSEWENEEIGRLLGLGPAAVRQLLARARSGLCAAYRRLGAEGGLRGFLPLPALWGLERTRLRGYRLRRWVSDLGAPGAAGTAEALGALATAITLVAGTTLSGAFNMDSAAAETTTASPAITYMLSDDFAGLQAPLPTAASTAEAGPSVAGETPSPTAPTTDAAVAPSRAAAGHTIGTAVEADDVQPVAATADASANQDEQVTIEHEAVINLGEDADNAARVGKGTLAVDCERASTQAVCMAAEPATSVESPASQED
jgi:RNA polymerase sigma-70 factor (ECF subfamily)